MAKFEIEGFFDYEELLQKLGKNTDRVVKTALYEGADEIADAIREGVKGLPEVKAAEAISAWRQDVPVDGITKEQKDGLLDGLYLAKMQTDAESTFTQIGFDGYNRVKTKAYPKGQPNAMIARAVESGSSARRKTPFVRPAAERSKDRAVQRMAAKMDETINEIMEGK